MISLIDNVVVGPRIVGVNCTRHTPHKSPLSIFVRSMATTMAKVPPSRRRRLPARRLSLPALLLSTVLSLAGAQDFYYYPTYPHGGGLWGSAKDAVDPITRPVKDAVCSQYGRLSDRGRFLAGACAGFTASRLAIKGESALCAPGAPRAYPRAQLCAAVDVDPPPHGEI